MLLLFFLVTVTPTATHVLTTTERPSFTTSYPPTTAPAPAADLTGKMFILSSKGGVTFRTPRASSPDPGPAHQRRSDITTTRPPWTTSPGFRGVSVCLRFLYDYSRGRGAKLFTLDLSGRDALTVTTSSEAWYYLSFLGRPWTPPPPVFLRPNKRFWPIDDVDLWTRLCLTMDLSRNLVQVFSGSNMSIKKFLPIEDAWSGEAVIDIGGFDGQVTDLQMWDHPLSYQQVAEYMSSTSYRRQRGSVLTWSNISYSVRGVVLLDKVYETQATQPISTGGRDGRRVYAAGKGEDEDKPQL